MKRLLILSIILLLSLSAQAQTPESNSGQPTIVDFPIVKLKEGGYIIFFRHTARNRRKDNKRKAIKRKAIKKNEIYIRDELSGRCKDSFGLSDKGIEEARIYKKNFEKWDIPVGKVYVSPTCRTRQMADIMFGEETNKFV